VTEAAETSEVGPIKVVGVECDTRLAGWGLPPLLERASEDEVGGS
jgi:hypothetical protein